MQRILLIFCFCTNVKCDQLFDGIIVTQYVSLKGSQHNCISVTNEMQLSSIRNKTSKRETESVCSGIF